MQSKSGWPKVDADLDAATDATRKAIKELNKRPQRNAAERQAVAADISKAKDAWFVEFGKAAIRSNQ